MLGKQNKKWLGIVNAIVVISLIITCISGALNGQKVYASSNIPTEKVMLADSPVMAATTSSTRDYGCTIWANQGWQECSGATVNAGYSYSVDAHGLWSPGPGYYSISAWGTGASYWCPDNKPVVANWAPLGALMIRRDGNPDPAIAGENFDTTPSGSGKVYFRINDCQGQEGDNQGSLIVHLSVNGPDNTPSNTSLRLTVSGDVYINGAKVWDGFNVRADYASGGGYYSSYTQNGHYSFSLPPGEYVVQQWQSGCTNVNNDPKGVFHFSVGASSYSRDIWIDCPGLQYPPQSVNTTDYVIYGKVTSDGKPASAGVRVISRDLDGITLGEAFTEGNGAYSMHQKRGVNHFSLYLSGNPPCHQELLTDVAWYVPKDGDPTKGPDFEIGCNGLGTDPSTWPKGSITGHVYQNGKPASGVTVNMSPSNAESSWSFSGVTDGNGVYTINNIVQAVYDVTASTCNASAAQQWFIPAPGNRGPDLWIDCGGGGIGSGQYSLHGHVYVNGQAPGKSIPVNIIGDDTSDSITVQTDNAGYYDAKGLLLRGLHHVEVNDCQNKKTDTWYVPNEKGADAGPDVWLDCPNAVVPVDPNARFSLHGHIHINGGAPGKAVTVVIKGLDNDDNVSIATDSAGYYDAINQLKRGSHRVTALDCQVADSPDWYVPSAVGNDQGPDINLSCDGYTPPSGGLPPMTVICRDQVAIQPRQEVVSSPEMQVLTGIGSYTTIKTSYDVVISACPEAQVQVNMGDDLLSLTNENGTFSIKRDGTIDTSVNLVDSDHFDCGPFEPFGGTWGFKQTCTFTGDLKVPYNQNYHGPQIYGSFRQEYTTYVDGTEKLYNVFVAINASKVYINAKLATLGLVAVIFGAFAYVINQAPNWFGSVVSSADLNVGTSTATNDLSGESNLVTLLGKETVEVAQISQLTIELSGSTYMISGEGFSPSGKVLLNGFISTENGVNKAVVIARVAIADANGRVSFSIPATVLPENTKLILLAIDINKTMQNWQQFIAHGDEYLRISMGVGSVTTTLQTATSVFLPLIQR